jgi:hypothetical protein
MAYRLDQVLVDQRFINSNSSKRLFSSRVGREDKDERSRNVRELDPNAGPFKGAGVMLFKGLGVIDLKRWEDGAALFPVCCDEYPHVCVDFRAIQFAQGGPCSSH